MKKIILIFFACFMTITTVGSAFVLPVLKTEKQRVFKVVLDAGHGGIDCGAIGTLTGVFESHLNLKITMLLKEYFEGAKFVVTLTRNGDYGLYGNESSGFKKRDLEKRAKIINDAHADIFISVHLNKYAHPSRRGAQVFYKLDSDDSKKYANAVQFQLNNLKESRRLYDVLPGDFYLLNTSSVKNAILVECGFLSNPEEERLLQTESYREKVAKAIFNGTLKYLLNL